MMAPGPLSTLRVLDFTSGPAALVGRLLADLGAEVLKVEPPAGDPGRHTPPFGPDGESLAFWHHNLGKHRLILAPADPRLPALVASADVVLEGGPAHPFDLAPLIAQHPHLIHAVLSGFGEGPRAHWIATELIAQAAGGMLVLNGEPGREPLRVPGEPATALAAQYLAAGILLALRARRARGRGQRVEVSFQEAVASATEPLLFRYCFEGQETSRLGDLHWVKGYAIVPCADGWVTVSWNRNFEHLVALLASDGQAGDLVEERYQDPAVVAAARDHVRATIAAWAASRSRVEIFARAQELRLPWAPVNTPAEVLRDPQLAARGFFVPLLGPGGLLPASSAPGHLSRTPWRPRQPLTPWNGPLERPCPPRRPAAEHRGAGALAGIRVLDFSWVLAGPYATRILADHGADVIKVQTAGKLVGYVSDGYFATWNRNKRSITLDLSHRAARTLVYDLVKLADVVVENFSARVLHQWGLDDEVLFALKPDLIVAHLTGMGRSGPYAQYVSYGPTAQALAGMSALTAYPGERPLGLGFSLADHLAGLSLALGVLAALEHRDRTGEGQVVDVSQLEATAWAMGTTFLEAALGQPQGPRDPARAADASGPAGIFRAAGEDRWLAVEVTSAAQQAALAAFLDCASSEEAPLTAALAAWAARQEPIAAARQLQARGIAASVVATAQDLLERDEGLRARGFFWETDHPTLGRYRSDGTPIRLAATPAPAPRPSPLLGQHNDEVFGELLGLTPEDIARLEQAGILS
jgi:crotonobetainyl-CoA:carnitine CoA-transferase CaiB-like acyl-CoA transferase